MKRVEFSAGMSKNTNQVMIVFKIKVARARSTCSIDRIWVAVVHLHRADTTLEGFAMTDEINVNRLSEHGAAVIWSGFGQYETEFRSITQRAKARFEQRDWPAA
jgi:hypothetical protein